MRRICLLLAALIALAVVQGCAAEGANAGIDLNSDLFLAPVLFDDETEEALTAPDTQLHFFPVAGRMWQAGSARLWGSTDMPEGYAPATESVGRFMHVRCLQAPTGDQYLPLFTSFDALFYYFGQNIRVGVLSYADAVALAADTQVAVERDGQSVVLPCAGIVIAPGILNQIIPADQMNTEN